MILREWPPTASRFLVQKVTAGRSHGTVVPSDTTQTPQGHPKANRARRACSHCPFGASSPQNSPSELPPRPRPLHVDRQPRPLSWPRRIFGCASFKARQWPHDQPRAIQGRRARFRCPFGASSPQNSARGLLPRPRPLHVDRQPRPLSWSGWDFQSLPCEARRDPTTSLGQSRDAEHVPVVYLRPAPLKTAPASRPHGPACRMSTASPALCRGFGAVFGCASCAARQ